MQTFGTIQLLDIVRNPELLIPFKKGQIIFKEGDDGDHMYVLFEGLVEVRVHEKVVGTFEPVEVFGEMAVIDPHPRSATVIAKTDCKLAKINQKRFLLLIQDKPQFAILVMRTLVERIRWMDAMAKEQAKNAQTTAVSQPAPDTSPDPAPNSSDLTASTSPFSTEPPAQPPAAT